jgi:hypothetical protein
MFTGLSSPPSTGEGLVRADVLAQRLQTVDFGLQIEIQSDQLEIGNLQSEIRCSGIMQRGAAIEVRYL